MRNPSPQRTKVAFLLAILLALFAAPDRASAREHPWLFFNSTEVFNLRSHLNDPYYADIYNQLKIDCRSRYNDLVLDPINEKRNYGEAIRSHAALCLLDPDLASGQDDDRYQSTVLFFTYYNTVLNYPGWSDFFGGEQLDTTYLLAALAVGFDWKYNDFTPLQRSDIVAKLADRADFLIDHTDSLEIPPDLTKPGSEYLNIFKVRRNKFIIAFSALGIISAALDGEVNEPRRQRWVNIVQNCMNAWSSNLNADGLCYEGYSYDEFALELLVQLLEIQTRDTGVNQFTRYPYMAQHPIYSLYSWVPGGDRNFIQPMPFGDCEVAPAGDMRLNVAPFARRLAASDPSMAGLANWMQYRQLNTAGNNNYARTDALHMFYADPSVPMLSPTALNLPTWHYFPEHGDFVWRSGWDSMATYFALTCGPQMGGHQQPEVGNFFIAKGGAPFVAHHGYTDTHTTSEHNVMMIGALGQWGEPVSGNTTGAQPPFRAGVIQQVLATDQFFDVLTNPAPIYKATQLTSYKREFVGFADYYFVRDVAAASASVQFDDYIHAYKTLQPTTINETTALNIDSARSANPWAGSSPNWTITARDPGSGVPFSTPMQVNDLSISSWSAPAPVSDVVNAHSGVSSRGFKLVRSVTGAASDSLMAFSFPGAGESILKWPAGDGGEGFKIMRSGVPKALCVWATTGPITGANGFQLYGAMGGVNVEKGWFWGRDVSLMAYNGVGLISTDFPVTFFADTMSAAGLTARVRCSSAIHLQFRVAGTMNTAALNGVALAGVTTGSGMMTVNLPAMPSGGTLTLANGVHSAASSDWLTAAPH